MISPKLLARLKNKSLLDLGGIVGGTDAQLFPVSDPSASLLPADQPLALLPVNQDMSAAIERAYRAFPAYSATLAVDRARGLRKLAALQRENAQDLAIILALESGKPIREALGEIEYGASYFEWFGEEARRMFGSTLPPTHENRALTVTRHPVGVCGCITPYNFGNAMLARKMAAALAAGCTVVARPSSETPLSAIALHNLAQQAIPAANVVNVVLGSSEFASKQGKLLCEDKRVSKLSFTGSTAVGKTLLAQCASTVKRTSMELGGNAPVIVYDCCDVDVAVKGIMQSKFRNAGQTCVCANRVFVQAAVFDAVVAGLVQAMDKLRVGNVLEESTDMGSLIHARAKQNVLALVKDAVDVGGATLVVGGGGSDTDNDNYVQPTLLVNANSSCRIAKEEIFGPVLSLTRFTSEQEAIAKANDGVDVGLAAYVFATNAGRIHRTTMALQAGVLGVNTGLISCCEAPFGGVKESGFGREGSQYGLDDYTVLKYVAVQH